MNFRDQFSLYFIRPIGLFGPLKIGLTGKTQRRLEEFQSWSPIPLEVMGTVPGTWADEQFLHGCLADYHSHGEWFHYSPAVIDAITEVLRTGSVESLRKRLQPVANLRSIRNQATRAKRSTGGA